MIHTIQANTRMCLWMLSENKCDLNHVSVLPQQRTNTVSSNVWIRSLCLNWDVEWNVKICIDHCIGGVRETLSWWMFIRTDSSFRLSVSRFVFTVSHAALSRAAHISQHQCEAAVVTIENRKRIKQTNCLVYNRCVSLCAISVCTRLQCA